jgi:hypothetical protein
VSASIGETELRFALQAGLVGQGGCEDGIDILRIDDRVGMNISKQASSAEQVGLADLDAPILLQSDAYASR